MREFTEAERKAIIDKAVAEGSSGICAGCRQIIVTEEDIVRHTTELLDDVEILGLEATEVLDLLELGD